MCCEVNLHSSHSRRCWLPTWLSSADPYQQLCVQPCYYLNYTPPGSTLIRGRKKIQHLMALVCIIQTQNSYPHLAFVQFFCPSLFYNWIWAVCMCVLCFHIHSSPVNVRPLTVGNAWMETDCLLTSYWCQFLCHYVSAFESAVHPGLYERLWFTAKRRPASHFSLMFHFNLFSVVMKTSGGVYF